MNRSRFYTQGPSHSLPFCPIFYFIFLSTIHPCRPICFTISQFKKLMEEYFDSTETTPPSNAYKLLFYAASLIPISHYAFGFLLVSFVVVYNFFEIHFFQDLFSGFRGQPVSLTFNSCSDLYDCVVSKCRTLHGR